MTLKTLSQPNTTKTTFVSALTKEDQDMLSKESKNFVSPRSNTLSDHTVDAVIKEVAEAAELSIPQASAGICILLQMGACARSCDNMLSIDIFGKTVRVSQLRKALKNNNANKAERKLARSKRFLISVNSTTFQAT